MSTAMSAFVNWALVRLHVALLFTVAVIPPFGSVTMAGGLQIGLLQTQGPTTSEERRFVALITNDLMPISLERAFNERYRVSPFVRSIPDSQVKDIDDFLRRAKRTHDFDVLIVPETKQLGSEIFVQFKVFDFRQEPADMQGRLFTAVPDVAGIRGIEGGLKASAERIAAAIFTKSSLSSRPSSEKKLDGLVYIWCIVPESDKDSRDAFAALELTTSLPYLLSQISRKSQALTFFGLGPREYFNECGNQPSTQKTLSGPKQAESTYTLSGQLVKSSDNETWLRAFAQDRSVGQTFALPPIRISGSGADEAKAGDTKRRQQVASDILDSFIAAIERRP